MNATLPYVLFEECQGLMAGVDVPNEKAETLFPSQFRGLGAAPFTTLFAFLAFNCPRAVVNNQTLSEFSAVWTFAWVEPTNESWRIDGIHNYNYDVLVSDPGVAAALGALGVPASVAEFDIQVTDAEEFVQESWTVAGNSLSLQFGIKHPPSENPGGRDEVWRWWFGENPFTMLSVKHDDSWYAPGADEDVALFEGSSSFRAAVGDAAAIRGTPIYSLQWIINSAPERFEEE